MVSARSHRPTIASLFSGCGGFDLGFVQAGYNLIAAFDNDPLAIQVHRSNFGQRATTLDLAEQLPDSNQLLGIDVLIAGPPCQGFSTIGKRSLDDPRNHLLLVAGQVALACQPKAVLVENVPAVKSGAHRKYWDALESMLRGAGYQTAELICEGPRLGLAQLRTRLVLVAWRSGREVTVSLPHQSGKTLADVLTCTTDLPNHSPTLLQPSSLAYQVAMHLKPGQKLSNVRGGGVTFQPGRYQQSLAEQQRRNERS